MASLASYVILSTVSVCYCLASYAPGGYRPRYDAPSYQTYDRRLIDSYHNVATTDSYPRSYQDPYPSGYSSGLSYKSAYQSGGGGGGGGGYGGSGYQSGGGGGYQSVYKPRNEYGSAGYGSYQTRNTYSTPHGGSLSSAYQLRPPSPRVTMYSVKNDYAGSSVKSYSPKSYDPCQSLPEGDYALQGDFRGLFSGVDSQCNFVKCANYKAYVNPCSMGTQNGENGGPHAKYGFCASLDYNHYCGHYPTSPQELEEYK